MSQFKLNTPEEVANSYFASGLGNGAGLGLGKVYQPSITPIDSSAPADYASQLATANQSAPTPPPGMVASAPFKREKSADMEVGPVKMLTPEPEKKTKSDKKPVDKKVVNELATLAKELKDKIESARKGRGGPSIPTPRSSLDSSDYARQADEAIGYQMLPVTPPGVSAPAATNSSAFEDNVRRGVASRMTAEPSLIQDYETWSKSSQPQDSGYKMNAGSDDNALARMSQIWERAMRNEASPSEMAEYQDLMLRSNSRNSAQSR